MDAQTRQNLINLCHELETTQRDLGLLVDALATVNMDGIAQDELDAFQQSVLKRAARLMHLHTLISRNEHA